MKEQMGEYLESATGSCFWSHKWSKWRQYPQKMINIVFGRKFYEDRQTRTCMRCGKVEDKLI